MKFTPIVLCCIILTIGNAFGKEDNFIKDLVGKWQEAGEKMKWDIDKFSNKVKTDIEKLLKPKTVQKSVNNLADTGNVKLDDKHVSLPGVNAPSTTAPRNTDRIMFPTDEPETSFTLPETPRTSTTAEPVQQSTTTDDKKGKENFVGGCLANYKRTKDGRCMPVY